MSFRRLDCFLAVARLKSFTAAARYLYLSQSAVSQQIGSLESELGFALFERGSGRTELTPAGAFLYPRILTLKDTYAKYIGQAAALAEGDTPVFTIGFDGPIAEEWIGRAATKARLDKRFDADLRFRRGSMATLTEYLIDDAVDVVVTIDIEVEKIDGVVFTPLIASTPCVYCPAGHRLLEMETVTLDDLAGESILGAYGFAHGGALSRTGQYLENEGIPVESLVRYPDGDTVFLAVSTGAGVFVASHLCDAFAARFGVESVDLRANLPQVKMGLAFRNASLLVEIFTDAARSALRGR